MATKATERFKTAAAAQGLEVEIQVFPRDTRTAQQAADAIGCELGQIVKSLVFTAGAGTAHHVAVASDGAGDDGLTGDELTGDELTGDELTGDELTGDEIVLVLTSGANQVDTGLAAEALGVAKLGRADADRCRAATGFAIGGIPPCGHLAPLRTVVDRDLMQYDTVWAAAGAPDAVFELSPEELVRVTAGTVATVAAST